MQILLVSCFFTKSNKLEVFGKLKIDSRSTSSPEKKLKAMKEEMAKHLPEGIPFMAILLNVSLEVPAKIVVFEDGVVAQRLSPFVSRTGAQRAMTGSHAFFPEDKQVLNKFAVELFLAFHKSATLPSSKLRWVPQGYRVEPRMTGQGPPAPDAQDPHPAPVTDVQGPPPAGTSSAQKTFRPRA